MTEEQKQKAEKLKWFHSIKLSETYTTKGVVSGTHTAEYATQRFGIPKDLKGKTVLDVGCYDGLFSFEAEKRGAKVLGIDYYQFLDRENLSKAERATKAKEANATFALAKEVLKSKVDFVETKLENFKSNSVFDVVFAFGILYHTPNPYGMIERLCELATERLIIETAICNSQLPTVEYRRGFVGDNTNYFYPSISFIQILLSEFGFESEVVYNDNKRATITAWKK